MFRWLSVGYAATLVGLHHHDGHFARPWLAWSVVAVMVGWTVVVTTRRPGVALLVPDLALGAGLLLATRAVESAGRLAAAPTLTVTWSAAPVVAWALVWGAAGGVLAGVVVGLASVAEKGHAGEATLGSLVLYVLTGLVVGYVTRLALDAQAHLRAAVELEAATSERERLARRIHDGVLQALALIHRRGEEIGGAAVPLATLAAEQEAALRDLVARSPAAAPAGLADVRALVSAVAGAAAVPVEVAAPGSPVLLPAHAAAELAAAVAAALDNVARHAGDGVRAWVLVEEASGYVTVSVRDDGRGFDPAGLAAAEAAGRLGVAQSMRGRLRDLGGTVAVDSAPGRGTEVELRVPSHPKVESGRTADR